MSLARRVIVGIGKGLRETGQALDRMGCRAQDNWLFAEKVCRHRALMNLFDQRPKIGGRVFIAPNATIVGNVDVKDESSVWCASTAARCPHLTPPRSPLDSPPSPWCPPP